jgi:hypothetical protein
MEKSVDSNVEMIGNEAGSGVESGPITKWIERYYEEKLDRRERSPKEPGAYLQMKKKKRDMLLMQVLNN